MHVHHREATIDGLSVFYREAGDRRAPTLVLLHGAPSSSFMFRNLIPLLMDRYHVIAPDLIGYGYSDAPSKDEFSYTFDSLAQVVAGLLEHLNIARYAIYVQDYGAPIGWRLCLSRPGQITGIISQNGNAYEDGFDQEFWADVWDFGADPRGELSQSLRSVLSPEAIQWQYTHGVPDSTLISPDTWTHDTYLLSRPGVLDAHMALLADYGTNRQLYPRIHEYFRETAVPLLAVWGKNDQIFIAPGAEAFQRDLPEARVHLLDGGHFLLESHLHEVANLMLEFLDTGGAGATN